MPVGKSAFDRIQPRVDAGLPGVDLLSATDEAHDDRPVVAVHVRHQELGLGLGEVGDTLLLAHEARRLFGCPRALSLVEDRHMLGRGAVGIQDRLVPKVVDVLDECLDALADLLLAYLLAEFPSSGDLVTRESFAKNGDERSVA